MMDTTLNRIAQDQATAMAARDVLDHEVAGSFSSRVASSGSGQAAENIAYGYDNFTKTLDQWINSSGHRKNLLMQGASRVGVASAKSSKTGRTYWAMVIAAAPPKATSKTRSRDRAPQPCRMSLWASACSAVSACRASSINCRKETRISSRSRGLGCDALAAGQRSEWGPREDLACCGAQFARASWNFQTSLVLSTCHY